MRFKIEQGTERFAGKFVLLYDDLVFNTYETRDEAFAAANKIVRETRDARDQWYSQYQEAVSELAELEEAITELAKQEGWV